MKMARPPLIVVLVCALTLMASPGQAAGREDISGADRARLEQNSDSRHNRPAFRNLQELLPTRTIDAGDGPVFHFQKRRPLNLDAITFEFHNPVTGQSSTQSVARMLRQTHTDALFVLKNGKIAYEGYFAGQTQRTRHQMNSVTKSFAGLLAATLVTEGKLKRDAKVIDYIPELKNSAYADATVAQVLDMTVGVRFSEDDNDPDSEVARYMAELGVAPAPPGYTRSGSVRKFLETLEKQGRHGERFFYVTPNTEVLCWLAERAGGKPFEKMLEERLWTRIGARRDAYFLVDPAGTPSCGGGFNATAEDLAKIGQMLLNNGLFNGRRILPAKALSAIPEGGNREVFSRSKDGQGILQGWSYRDQFWVRHSPDQAYAAIGVSGQWIYIVPKEGVVIVKQSGLTHASSDEIDAYALAAFDAIVKALR